MSQKHTKATCQQEFRKHVVNYAAKIASVTLCFNKGSQWLRASSINEDISIHRFLSQPQHTHIIRQTIQFENRVLLLQPSATPQCLSLCRLPRNVNWNTHFIDVGLFVITILHWAMFPLRLDVLHYDSTRLLKKNVIDNFTTNDLFIKDNKLVFKRWTYQGRLFLKRRKLKILIKTGYLFPNVSKTY